MSPPSRVFPPYMRSPPSKVSSPCMRSPSPASGHLPCGSAARDLYAEVVAIWGNIVGLRGTGEYQDGRGGGGTGGYQDRWGDGGTCDYRDGGVGSYQDGGGDGGVGRYHGRGGQMGMLTRCGHWMMH
ncbi:glycine-rich RNA-binding protein GRP1A-like [Olea europaea var. sylvestris]|uniref:glycine-rich RNA-binding protein GRP1A-like n=1 Tax=Olea europaea var. sylvestris TaxID=158386 RepID=UPI000C1D37ED|nr:glycine-rich RNA-binding protein GRP1A-like [Olea europaea var. sylvestris]